MTREKFRFAGQTVKVRNEIPKFGGADFIIEDYWQNVTGGLSWMDSNGNPAAMMYAIRTGSQGLTSRSTTKSFMERSVHWVICSMCPN